MEDFVPQNDGYKFLGTRLKALLESAEQVELPYFQVPQP